jgi:hypothetical protein
MQHINHTKTPAYWDGYSAIAHANQALDAIEKLEIQLG